jgi:hypothetical protein
MVDEVVRIVKAREHLLKRRFFLLAYRMVC